MSCVVYISFKFFLQREFCLLSRLASTSRQQLNFIVLRNVKEKSENISGSFWHKSFIQTPKYYIFEDKNFYQGF